MCELNNSVNWYELIIGALIGFGVSFLWDRIKLWQRSELEKKKYSFLIDKYYSKDNTGNLKAEADIFYIKDNLLKITVKHDDEVWKGTIIMSTAEFGNLSFSYTNSPENVGMKLIVLSSDRNSFTLIPEVYYMTSKEKEFEKEIFTRKNVLKNSLF